MTAIIKKSKAQGNVRAPSSKSMAHRLLICAALAKGLVSRGVNLVSGGTDNHLILVDLRSLGITGKELEQRLDKVYITANKNAIPNDPE